MRFLRIALESFKNLYSAQPKWETVCFECFYLLNESFYIFWKLTYSYQKQKTFIVTLNLTLILLVPPLKTEKNQFYTFNKKQVRFEQLYQFSSVVNLCGNLTPDVCLKQIQFILNAINLSTLTESWVESSRELLKRESITLKVVQVQMGGRCLCASRSHSLSVLLDRNVNLNLSESCTSRLIHRVHHLSLKTILCDLYKCVSEATGISSISLN